MIELFTEDNLFPEWQHLVKCNRYCRLNDHVWANFYPVQTNHASDHEYLATANWIIENLGGKFAISNYTFFFELENDAVMFKLFWG